MKKTRLPTWKRPVVVVSLMAVTVLMTIHFPGLRPQDFLLRYWQRDLDLIAEDKIPRRLQQIGQLGPTGVPVLVQMLDASRPALAEGAKRALHTALDRWQGMGTEQSSLLVAKLLRELAGQVEDFDSPARAAAADLANRGLRWPVDHRVVDHEQLVIHVEQVFRAAIERPLPVESSSPDASAPHVAQSPDASTSHRVAVQPLSGETDLGAYFDWGPTELPGGDLPTEPVQLAPLPTPSNPSPPPGPASHGRYSLAPAPDRLRTPREIFPTPQSSAAAVVPQEQTSPEPLPDTQRPTPALETPPPLKAARPDHRTSSGRSPNRAFPNRTSPWDEDPVPPRLLEDDLPSLSGRQLSGRQLFEQRIETIPDLQIMQKLDDDRPQVVRQVKDQLQRRGFSPLEIDMARQMIDPDPNARIELAESLLTRPVQPQRWLRWLSADEDPRVRQIAVALMAATRDTTLHRRLDAMQEQERHPTVRKQLQKSLEELRRWAQADTSGYR